MVVLGPLLLPPVSSGDRFSCSSLSPSDGGSPHSISPYSPSSVLILVSNPFSRRLLLVSDSLLFSGESGAPRGGD